MSTKPEEKASESKQEAKAEKKGKPKGKGQTPEEIFAAFQTIKTEHDILRSKWNEIETDLGEHKLVVEQLKTLDSKRKCFRMIGGVLCEKTVGEILPELIHNRDQLATVASTLTAQIAAKTEEMNEWKKSHDLKDLGLMSQGLVEKVAQQDNQRAAVLASSN